METEKRNAGNETLASEIIQEQLAENREDLRQSNKTMARVNAALLAIIALMIVGMVAMSMYHEWMWAQFDTIVVDSSEGEGYANYVTGENNGGIYNGEGNGS